MSKWTKILFSVAFISQIILFVYLNDCKLGNVYYINETDLFLMGLCSVTSIMYVVAGMMSHQNDKALARL